MESRPEDTLVLSAESLYRLPLDVRIYIANMDIDTYIWLYLHDLEFREYATRIEAINDFVERFVVIRLKKETIYKLGNIEYRKYDNGGQLWRMNDEYHRIGGPAILFANGEQRWYMNGKLHRIDGPARISADGDEWWYIDGNYHRDGGPAIIHIDGYKAYYWHDKRHRLDGPAIIYVDGREDYWEYGKEIR